MRARVKSERIPELCVCVYSADAYFQCHEQVQETFTHEWKYYQRYYGQHIIRTKREGRETDRQAGWQAGRQGGWRRLSS